MSAISQQWPTDEFSLVENGAIAGRYLAQYWQPIALSRDYAAGKARRIKMLGSHYTLYRGENEALNLVQDRCPHRGTSLAYGWVEGNSIRCRYHGWKFASGGQGEEFPAETATYARNICLKTYPVREYLGVIFGYFGDGEAPAFPRFPELEDESAGELLSMAVVLPYNFFQRVENDVDEVHIHFTHREFVGNFGLVDHPRVSAKETDYGLVSVATRSDGSKLYTHAFMPNIMLREVAIQQDRTALTIHAAWRVPIDDGSTLSVMIDRVAKFDESMRESWKNMIDPTVLASRVMACEMTLDEVDENHPLLPVIQDTVCMAGQGIIADRRAEHLGASDRSIALLRRLWKREMDALQAGHALKRWHRPESDRLPMFDPGVEPETAETPSSAISSSPADPVTQD